MDTITIAGDRFALADLIESLPAAASDPRYHTAAAVLRGEPAGRPAIDDGPALAQMRVMLEHGQARSVHQAARFVARAMPGHSPRGTEVRLARKYARAYSRKFNECVAPSLADAAHSNSDAGN
jgi:hypothetical protein